MREPSLCLRCGHSPGPVRGRCPACGGEPVAAEWSEIGGTPAWLGPLAGSSAGSLGAYLLHGGARGALVLGAIGLISGTAMGVRWARQKTLRFQSVGGAFRGVVTMMGGRIESAVGDRAELVPLDLESCEAAHELSSRDVLEMPLRPAPAGDDLDDALSLVVLVALIGLAARGEVTLFSVARDHWERGQEMVGFERPSDDAVVSIQRTGRDASSPATGSVVERILLQHLDGPAAAGTPTYRTSGAGRERPRMSLTALGARAASDLLASGIDFEPRKATEAHPGLFTARAEVTRLDARFFDAALEALRLGLRGRPSHGG